MSAELVKAEAKWVRISPRKVKRVTDLIRGKSVREALALLKFMPHKGARLLVKVIKSAAANAKNNYKLKEEGLFVAQVYATKGLTFTRFQPRARGRMDSIKKRSSHIRVYLQEK